MKKIIALVLSLAMVFTLSIPAFAAEPVSSNNTQIISVGEYLTLEDQAFFDKLESVFPYFALDDNNKLFILLKEEELTSSYGFSANDISRLHDLLAFQHDAIDGVLNVPQPQLHVADWKIYFTNDDVHSTLFVAAQGGTAAVMAALSALGSIYPGVGTVVGAVVGLIGGGTIIYYVFQAVALGTGLYIGVDWNGPFPNPAIGLW